MPRRGRKYGAYSSAGVALELGRGMHKLSMDDSPGMKRIRLVYIKSLSGVKKLVDT